MAELKTKKLVFNADGKTHVITGSRFEDILTAMGITELRFYELLSRDAYCPTLSAAPSTSTLTYNDTDGSTNHFHVGQLCRWAEDNGYRIAVCTGISDTEASWYTLPERLSELEDDMGYITADGLSAKGYATTAQLSAKQDKVLKFENLTASSWASDSTYGDYPYRCDLACAGVTADMYAEVAFALEQAVSGSYAPLCETKAGIVSIWSTENTTITVPTIIVTA